MFVYGVSTGKQQQELSIVGDKVKAGQGSTCFSTMEECDIKIVSNPMKKV